MIAHTHISVLEVYLFLRGRDIKLNHRRERCVIRVCLAISVREPDLVQQELARPRVTVGGWGQTNGMWSRVLDKNSTSFAQECTVRLFIEVGRSAGAAATSGVGLPGPAADHRNSFSSWRYLATWRELARWVLAYLPEPCRRPLRAKSQLVS